MNYQRFSSWASDDEEDRSSEDSSQPDSVQPAAPSSVEADSPEEIIDMLLALEEGESVEMEMHHSVFDHVYLEMRKKSPSNKPSYANGVLYFTKGG